MWLRKMKIKMQEAGLKVHLLKKYVDDVLVVCSMARVGQRYIGGELIRTCETFSEDKSSGRTSEENTLEILETMVNSIYPYLKFTGEASTPERAIPVLDCSMKISKMEQDGESFREEEGYKPPWEINNEN